MSLTISPLVSRIVSPSITRFTCNVCACERLRVEMQKSIVQAITRLIENGIFLLLAILSYSTEPPDGLKFTKMQI